MVDFVMCGKNYIWGQEDSQGLFCDTEEWPEWSDVDDGKPGALQEKILPIALDVWDDLVWQHCPVEGDCVECNDFGRCPIINLS